MSAETIPYPQVAEAMGVTPLTIRRLITAKKLRASHVARRVRIRPTDLDAYLAANAA